MKDFKTIHLNAEYASQELDRVPLGAYIDKTLPGTGFTTLALQDDRDCIIAMPTKRLIHNKMFSKEGIDYEKEGIRLAVQGGVTREEIRDYIDFCKLLKRPIKILITYASLGGSQEVGNTFAPKLDFVLEENPNISLIIDETQEMLGHAENNPHGAAHIYSLVDKYTERVSFISATPPERQFLSKAVQKLEPIRYTWDYVKYTTRFEMQTSKQYHTVAQMINDIEFVGELKVEGLTPNPRKLIIFINSITNIKKIIQLTDVPSKERLKKFGFIAADNIQHDVTLKGCARSVSNYAKLPKYTFVTAAGISGIDLFDEEAMTVVVSSTKKDWQMLDMNLDLPQAISRQRIKSNPFYGKFIFVYNQCEWDLSLEEMLEKFETDVSSMNWEIDNKINPAARNGADKELNLKQYHQNFKAYLLEEEDGTFGLNDAFLGARKHRIVKIHTQYSKGFAYKGLDNDTETLTKITLKAIKRRTYRDYAEHIMTQYGTIDEANEGQIYYEERQVKAATKFLKVYCHQPAWIDYIVFGMSQHKILLCAKAAKYNYESNKNPMTKLYSDINLKFSKGDFYSNKDIKLVLSTVYKKHKLARKAKGSDINQFYEVETKAKRVNGKVVNGKILVTPLFEIA